MILDYRWVVWGPLGVLQSHEKAKNRKRFHKLSSSQYLKGYASELLTCGFVASRTGQGTMILDYRWVVWGPLRVLQSHEKAKNRKKFHKLGSSQYLKGYASELLTCGFVASRMGHGTMILEYRWVIWGPLGVFQIHENEKNRKKCHKLAGKSISQEIC
jgi:hypothetical protein